MYATISANTSSKERRPRVGLMNSMNASTFRRHYIIQTKTAQPAPASRDQFIGKPDEFFFGQRFSAAAAVDARRRQCRLHRQFRPQSRSGSGDLTALFNALRTVFRR